MFHNKSIFKKYVLTYCVVIFIPTLLVFGLCLFQYVTAKHTIEKQYETSLSQTQSSVDQYFEEIDNIVHQLLLNPTAIMYFSSQSNNIVAYDAHSVLSLYSFSNPLIDNIILYNRHDDRITDFSTTFNLSDSYSDTISVGNYTYEQFTNNFLNVKNYQKLYPCQNLKYYDRASNVLLYVTSYPIGYPNDSSGAIIVVIPAEKVFAKFNYISENNGYFYMIDKDNNTILSSANAPALTFSRDDISLNTNKRFILHKAKSDRGITYVSAIPYNAVLSKMKSSTYYMIFLLTAMFLATSGLILFLAKRTSAPIKEMAKALNTETDDYSNKLSTGTDELNFISQKISLLIEKNKISQEELSQHTPFLVAAFAQELLYGTLLSAKEIESQAHQLGITLGEKCIVLIISIPDSISDLDTISTMKLLIKRNLSASTYSLNTDLSEYDLGLIITLNDSDSLTAIEEIINEIGAELYKNFSSRIKVSIGTVCDSPSDIFHSYCIAKNNLIHGMCTINRDVEWFVENKTTNQRYYYPIDIEQRIITSLLNKRVGLAIESVSLLKKVNIDNQLLNIDQTLLLFRNIKGTIYRCLNEITIPPTQQQEMENELEKFDSIYDLASGFDFFAELLRLLDSYNQGETSDNKSSDIFQYMSDNFTDPLFDRNMLAKHFDITPEYASSFFKSNTGYSFSEYLEKIRIAEACKFLSENNLSINDIAKKVGYNSDLSFRRAFKRRLGVSPTEYVKKQIKYQ